MESRAQSRLWAIAAALVAIVLIVVLAGLYVFDSIRAIPGDVVEGGLAVAGRIGELADAFKQGSVDTTFASYAAQLSGSSYLQVATLRQMEVHTRADRSSVLWGYVALPDVVVAATAPVEYTYFLDFDETWSFDLRDNVLVVNAPAIRFNEPAIDVSELHFEIRESSLLRDENEVVRQLKSALTQLSRDRALDHVDLIRETARNQTKDFVRQWMKGTFSDAEWYRIEVVFADELPGVEGTISRD